MGGGQTESTTTLLDYVRVLRRRKWIAVQAALLVPLAAVLFSLQQSKRYQASADVLLSNQNLAAALAGVQQSSGGVSLQADRVAQTQADVARSPVVAVRTLRAARVTSITPDRFLAESSVSPKTNADLLEFTVTTGDPTLATRLASEYARQFRLFKQQLDTLNLKKASTRLQQRIDQLKADGGTTSQLYAGLVESQQTLQTLATLQTSNAYVVRNADKAVQVQPKPARNGILGLLLGLVLGVGLAFLWESLDTRVRSAEEVAARLRLPLLGRLPAPSRQLASGAQLAMVDERRGAQAEAFRMLRTNVDFMNLDRGARTIMVTSALEGEGKTTTAANLAIAFARTGRKVALVELDLRRPTLYRYFGGSPEPGITNVALGASDLPHALRRIPVVGAEPEVIAGWNGHANGNGNGSVHGALQLLTAGALPPDPGEFLSTQALAEILHRVQSGVDLVIVDSPPLLHVGDAMMLTEKVDAVLLVARLGAVKRPMLDEVDRLLARCPATLIGVVATGAETDAGYGYGYGANTSGRTAVAGPVEDVVR